MSNGDDLINMEISKNSSDNEIPTITSIKIENPEKKSIKDEDGIELLFGNNIHKKHPKKLGNISAFFYIKNNWPLITIGPDFIGLTSFFYFLEYFTIFENNFFTAKLIETLSYLFFLISYLLTCLINPGTLDNKYYINNFIISENDDISKYQKCKICNIIFPKKLKVVHCKICNICIIEQDHHCPWTGKCIGKYNIIQFNCFLAGILIFMLATFMTFLLFIIHLEEED